MSKNIKNKFPYATFETYCIRTPLLPLEYYYKLTSNVKTSAFELKNQLDDKIISEAIFLASPELYYQLIKWKNDKVEDEKKKKRLKITLLKYLIRMSTRCTPFGMFATIGTGKIDVVTRIESASNKFLKKKSHFDMHFLVNLVDNFLQQSRIRKCLKFYHNTSLYKTGNRYRYVEYQYDVNKKRLYTLESVAHSSYLELILSKSSNGATPDQMTLLLKNLNFEEAEAVDFIDKLIDNQILVSELEPSTTGTNFLEDINNIIDRLEINSNESEIIHNLRHNLSKIDNSLGLSIENYNSIVKLLSDLKITYDKKYLIQTDTSRQYTSNTISWNTLKKVKQGVAFLNKISEQVENPNLKYFKTKFIQRYNHARIPILKALDVESGIGYKENSNSSGDISFLEGIIDGNRINSKNISKTQFGSLEKVLTKKVGEALWRNELMIELTDDDFPNLEYSWNDAPDTMSILSEITIQNGQEKVFMNYCSPHAARILGRFGEGDEKIEELLKDIAQKEASQNPDKILAEIVHLPESRAGNILRRPHIRNYEIPYLGKSNLSRVNQINLKDVEVTVENGLIKLFLKESNKQILPRLSNAHDYGANSLPVYHFLCDLQYQDQKTFGFSWSEVFREFKRLPRLTYKDCIIAKARWNITREEFINVFKAIGPKEITLEACSKWRNKYKIPEIVQLVKGENTMSINLLNYDSIEMLTDLIKNDDAFILEEFLHNGQGVVKMESQDLCNQIVFTFYKNRNNG